MMSWFEGLVAGSEPSGDSMNQSSSKSIFRLTVLAVASAVAAGSITWAGVRWFGSDGSASGPPMIEVAPGGLLDPADVPEGLAVYYRAAVDHGDVFAQVPCFCGCEEMLGHRHLRDCFVRADGWEAHALGCGVCLGEAAQVIDLLAAGETDSQVIRDAVIARWSDPYLTR